MHRKEQILSSGYSDERFKVLYVCPLAHLEGHPCFAAISETEALAASGQKVTLLTFAGLLSGNVSEAVNHMTVLKPSLVRSRRFVILNSRYLTSGLFVSIAFLLTMLKAMSLKKSVGYDVIQIRDATGLFMSFPQF